ncbi:hypothetical protein [Treponema sp.]|uniref:hypothetical protein n=1 Tax=Treponema sp. TaxID=166 RepID=UPI00298E4739|nr:hypothetical protein [Treponema sp.]MCQ2242238.1 hypothetical protein [Treponema sp.]
MIKQIGKVLEDVRALVSEGSIEKNYEKVGTEFLSRLNEQFYTYACLCTYAVVNDMEYEQANKLYKEYVYEKNYGSWDSVKKYFLTGKSEYLNRPVE